MPGYKRSYVQKILLILVAAFFVVGINRLFLLRFQVGDVYPAYSSLRSDPMGARALYESLDNLPGISADRNFRPISRLRPEHGAALFILGARPVEEIPEESMNVLTRITENSGRIVIGFNPQFSHDVRKPATEINNEKEEPKTDLSGKMGESEEQPSQTVEEAEIKEQDLDEEMHPENIFFRSVSIPEILGVQYGYDNKAGKAVRVSRQRGPASNMPDEIPWFTGLFFDELHEDWQVLYTSNDKAVIIERRLAAGSIVMVADSYLFSNEALRNEAHAGLLAWLVGNSSKIVFEEAHFGISEQRGITFLIKKYQLTWFALGLLVIAALFIWKRSVSLIPPRQEDAIAAGYDFRSDQDYLQGLESILHRNISRRDILATSFREWQKSGIQDMKGVSGQQVEAIKKILQRIGDLEGGGLDQVNGYNEICKIISRKGP